MTQSEKIAYQMVNKKYCKVIRQVGGAEFNVTGYIISATQDFIMMQWVSDFFVSGYAVFAISTIAELRYNKGDKHFDKILRKEKLHTQALKKYDIDLSDWTSIFRSIKKTGLLVTIENEDPNDYSFDLGPIIKTTKNAVYMYWLSPDGYLDSEITKIRFDQVSLVQFDDHYANILGKYIKPRKMR